VSNPPEELIPPHGGYRRLKSYQLVELCYDVTARFCERYVNKFSGTNNQMVQAARSGVRNISEGSKVSGTSKRIELKLTDIARGSLDELRGDYRDFLRHGKLKEWSYHDPRRAEIIAKRCATAAAVAKWVEEVHGRSGQHGQHRQSGQNGRRETYAEIAANATIILIGVACSLLNRQIAALARNYVEQGGFTERMYRIRRQRQHGNH
jgi:four helix bundle suffix protein